MRYSSAIMTRAPWPAAMRAARTPPDPPPMTNRSTSKSAMSDFDRLSDFLATLAHLGAERTIDGLGELLRPLIHVCHAGPIALGSCVNQLLAQRRLVEGDEVLQLLLGELAGIDLRHAVADLASRARRATWQRSGRPR